MMDKSKPRNRVNMSQENIDMDLLRQNSSSSTEPEDERDNNQKRKRRISSNMIEPYSPGKFSPLSPSDKAFETNDALKEMVNVVIDPGERRSNSELDMILSLHQAAREGDIAAIKHYLSFPKTKSKLNALDEEKLSPLHYAARYNNYNVIELLLANGADVNVIGDEGLSPLHYAARYQKKRKTRTFSAATIKSTDELSGDENCDENNVVKYLVGSGARINGQDKYGMTPLHYAAMRGNEVAAKDLLTFSDIKIEMEDRQLITPLHYAALYGHLDILKLLVEAGANLRVMGVEKHTPLHYAADEGQYKIVEYLLNSADERGGWPSVAQMVADKDLEANTPLHQAVENGHSEIVKLLLPKGANVNSHRKNFIFPLHQAATNGHLEIVKLLIQNNARIDCLNIYQSTPLHRAAAYNHRDVVEYLLSRGANIEAKDRDGFTPLLWATCNGHTDTVISLLNHGADITAVDKCDKTAIYIAAEENCVDVMAALLQNVNSPSIIDYSDKYDNSPLHAAAEDGNLNIIKMLLDNGLDILNKNEEGKNALHVAAEFGRTRVCGYLVSKYKLIIHDEDEDSNTALHLAALNGHYRVLKLLLQNGAEVEAINSDLWTALDCAAANGHLKSSRVLLEQDSPIDPTDRNKTTPLHLASQEGYANVVKLLLDQGADIGRRNAKGKNCLDLAISNGQKEVALTIVNHDKWMDALRNERKDSQEVRVTPLRELIRRMPDVAEVVFKRCIKTNGLPVDHYNLEVTFNYEFLDDAFTCYNYEDHDKLSLPNIYDENNKVLPGVNLYSDNHMELKMNHPLSIMARVKRQGLLGHPLCTSLLEYKWKLFGRYVFYTNLLIYAIFLILLTGYALYETDPFTAKLLKEDLQKVNPNTTWDDVAKVTKRDFVIISRYGIVILVGFHILREIFQMHQRKWHYFNLENLMEWTCYVCSALYVLNFYVENYVIRTKWQWEIGAIAVFLAWVDLVLIMRKFPFLGLYVVMFTDILKTFCKFCIIFFLFVIAFALGFHLLLHDKNVFYKMHQSLIKTSVMMIGEFEFDSIFNDPSNDQELKYPGLSLALFCIFLIVMSIILMNLLVGLAVDDIKAVAEQAALQTLAMQADLVLSVEEFVPNFLRRRFTRREKKLYPNRRYKFKMFTYLFQNSTEYLDSVANALNYKEEMKYDQLKFQQEEMLISMHHMKDNMKQLMKQNRRLQDMIIALVQKNDIVWEEDDELSSL